MKIVLLLLAITHMVEIKYSTKNDYSTTELISVGITYKPKLNGKMLDNTVIDILK